MQAKALNCTKLVKHIVKFCSKPESWLNKPNINKTAEINETAPL